jgi:hypothetical protein
MNGGIIYYITRLHLFGYFSRVILQNVISWEKVGNEIYITGYLPGIKDSEVMISRPRG